MFRFAPLLKTLSTRSAADPLALTTAVGVAAASCLAFKDPAIEPIQCEEVPEEPPKTLPTGKSDKNRIIFLGTGSSTGCPMPRCPMIFSDSEVDAASDCVETDSEVKCYREQLRKMCHVSILASSSPPNPRYNKNYRNNPSLLITHSQVDDHGEVRPKNVIIDVGKTFRETANRWFPVYGVHFLDAVILTHEHADAVFGMDDLRGLQKIVVRDVEKLITKGATGGVRQVAMPVFLSQHCLDKVAPQFPWLFPNHQPNKESERKEDETKQSTDKEEKPKKVVRHVASLGVTVFESFQPFQAAGLKVIPLPVMHGEDLVSYGFAFTVGSTNIVYISDVSRMLPETLDFIQNQLPPTDILIVDALHPHRIHPVHFCLEQAVDLALNHIRPRQQTFVVGMNCDSFLPHDEMNAELSAKYGPGKIQFAHDGLEILC